MSTPHINAPGAEAPAEHRFAESVLLPGSPMRAKWIAETFLSNSQRVNNVRGTYGYTGRYKDKLVSVQATGMGQPSTAIYAEELIAHYGVKNLIRVGTCGSISKDINVMDLVIGMGASTDSSVVTGKFPDVNFSPIADYDLLSELVEQAHKSNQKFHVGNLFSTDSFYGDVEDGELSAKYLNLAKHGILGVEMEAAALFTIAARNNVRAAAICTVSDNLVTGKQISSDDRDRNLHPMIEIALESLISHEKGN